MCANILNYIRWAELADPKEGFYLSNQTRNEKATAILAVKVEATTKRKYDSTTKSKKDQITFQIYRPNTGLQIRHETLTELEKKYKKVTSDEAEAAWTEQYDASINTCSHAYWRGNCRNVNMGLECEVRIGFDVLNYILLT